MLNPWEALVRVVWEPGKTFEELSRYEATPVWQPIIAMMAGSVLVVSLLLDEILAMTRRELIAMEMPVEMIEMSLTGVHYGVYVGVVFSVLPLLLIPLILLFVGQFAGAEASYRQLLTVVGYAFAVPTFLGGLLQVLFVKFAGGYLVDTSFSAAVFLSEDVSPFLSNLATALNPFNIWMLVLVIVGYSVFNRIDIARSSRLIVGLWFVSMFVSAWIAGLV